MARNGTGTFVRLYNWVTDKTNSVPITASRMDAEFDGMATALSQSIAVDGQSTVTANIPMASHKFTGLSVGNARTDSLTLGQVQDGQYTALGLTGGAADAYTATPTPAITAYVATMEYSAKIHATNLTTTPTLLISAISGGIIKKLDASKTEIAVEASDMLANGFYKFKRNIANDAWILLNPEKSYDKYLILDSAAINNLGLTATVAANALTVALKTKAGTDASATDPVKISFRNATLTTGTYDTVSATAATSLVVSSGSTLGTINAIAATLYVYALNNSGTIELGISSTLFEDNSIQSSTAEGGAGAADSSTVLYSTTARSNIPIRLIGSITITEATAGTWVTSPTKITLVPSATGLFVTHPSVSKAWVNFTGTGTVTINDSYNTTSITDNGTGDYTWNIATDFSSANWAFSGGGIRDSATARAIDVSMDNSTYTIAAGTARFLTYLGDSASLEDPLRVFCFGFGNQ